MIEQSCKQHLTTLLTSTGLGPEDVEDYAWRGIKDFKYNTMQAFRSPEQDYTVEVAGSRFNNSAIRARRGRVTLSG
jgi:hypothetical protein